MTIMRIIEYINFTIDTMTITELTDTQRFVDLQTRILDFVNETGIVIHIINSRQIGNMGSMSKWLLGTNNDLDRQDFQSYLLNVNKTIKKSYN